MVLKGYLAHARETLSPIGSVHAVSDPVPVLFIPVALTSQLFSDFANFGGDPVDWFVAASIGYAALYVVFVLGRPLIARRPTLLRVLAVFVVAGLSRSLSVGFVAVELGLSESLDPAYRLAAGLLMTPSLLGVIAYAVSTHAIHRDLVAELEGKRASLQETERTMETRLADTTDALADAVKDTIAPSLGALDSSLAAVVSSGSAGTALDTLSALLDDEIRPLSHQLAAENHSHYAASELAWSGPVRVPLPERFRISDGIRPGVVALLATAVAAPSTLLQLPAPMTAMLLVTLPIYTFILLLAIKAVFGKLEFPTPLAALTVTAVYALAAGASISLLRDIGVEIPLGMQLSGIVICALIGAMVVMAELVGRRRSATEQELARVVERLEISVGIVRRRVQLTRRRLAHVLHGSMQGALYAAAVRLSEGELNAENVAAIQRDIAKALAKLDQGGVREGSQTLRSLSEIAGMWGKKRAVTSLVSDDAAAALAADPDADEALAELIREAVNNAVRHGQARNISVSIAHADIDGLRALEMEVSNDGAPWSANAGTGLGTSTFDELCIDWGHIERDGKTVVRARLVVI